MRKFFVVLALLALPAGAQAAKYGMAGCGLGSIVFADEPGMIQIVAATLNGTGVQTFGITTGTSNCDGGAASASLDQKVFIRTNYASLMRDAAAGEGEYLSSLGMLMGCEDAAMPRFGEMTQAQHEALFSAGSPEVTLEQMKQSMAQDEVLSASCARI